MGHEKHTVAVFAPVLSLTVTVEAPTDNGTGEIHFHPGGQGFWIARMLRHLGERPLLCGPIGGESGSVIRGLLPSWGIDISHVETDAPSPVTAQDRRSGERELIAETHTAPLQRHSSDELYGRFLDHAITAGVAVITGQVGQIFPLHSYRRLAHDLRSTDVKVVGDLHGPVLASFLEGGPLDFLKVSDNDMRADGLLKGDDEPAALATIQHLVDAGASNVVLSCGDKPTFASINGRIYKAITPELEAADFRGAGDSMTAALASSLRSGSGPEDTLKLACGAGAANVTRLGLGSASEALFSRLADQVKVTTISHAV